MKSTAREVKPVIRGASLNAALVSVALMLGAVAASAQPASGMRETVGAYVKGTTTHAQFESDMQRAGWTVNSKQIQSSQSPDKTWTVSVRYLISVVGGSCKLEFKGPLEVDKKSLDSIRLFEAGC